MAQSQVIKSYQIGLGFKWDEDTLHKFGEAMHKTHLAVRNFAIGLTGLAVAAEHAISRVAKNYESLFYLSERTGTNVNALKAMGYAFSQIGLQAGQAGQQLTTIATAFRDNMNLEPWLKGIVGNFKGAEGAMQAMVDEYERLLNLPNTPENQAKRQQFRQIIRRTGADPEVLLQEAKHNKELAKYREEATVIYRKFGLDMDQATGRAMGMMGAQRRVWEYVGAAFDKVAIVAMPLVTRLFEKFADWMNREGGKKLTQWADDLEDWIEDFDFTKVEEALKRACEIATQIWNVFKFIVDTIGLIPALLIAAFAPSLLKGLLFGVGQQIAAMLFGISVAAGTAGVAAGTAYGTGFMATLTKIIGGVAVAALLQNALKGAADMVDQWMSKTFGEAHGRKQAQMMLEQDKAKSERGTLGTILNAPNDIGDWLYGPPKPGLDYLQSHPDMPGAKEYFERNPEHRAANPHGYSASPVPAFGTGANQALESIYMGLQHWWSGSGAFRPLVVLTETFYDKLTAVLREVFLGDESEGANQGGGGGGGGDGGGGDRGTKRLGGRFGGMGPGGGGGTVEGGGKVSPEGGGVSLGQMKKLAMDAGFSEEEAGIMAATAMHESSGNPYAVGKAGEQGLTQIHPVHGALSTAARGDPKAAFQAAYKIYKMQGWQAWSSYKSGAYKQYLEAAQKAKPEDYNPKLVDGGGGGPGGGRTTGGEKSRGVNQELNTAMQAAFKEVLPAGWHAQLTSGVREGDPGAHGRGAAEDWQIWDDKGNKIRNRGEDTTGYYRKAAVEGLARMYMNNPQLARTFAWGGHFGTQKGGGGELDIMHYDAGFQGPRGRYGDPMDIHRAALSRVRQLREGGGGGGGDREGQSVLASAASITENAKAIVGNVKKFDTVISNVSKGLGAAGDFASRSALLASRDVTGDQHPAVEQMDRSIQARNSRLSRGVSAAAGANTYHNVVMNVNGEDSNAVGKSVKDHLAREFTQAAQHFKPSLV
jgi:hypothetical protein